MPAPPEELEAAALALPREERAHLAKQLIASLDEDDEVQMAWQDEVRRRLDAYRNGEVDDIAADDVLDEARRRSQP